MNRRDFSRRLAIAGMSSFFIGMSIMLLEFLSFLHFLVPVLVMGGVCLMIIASFIGYKNEKSR
ncbi:hypothetical protein Q7A53_09715 [Halobacillus rhizosphaerae]|uniref:hypothetical protein n=1 Tax=Halobacillus rhizosphaerae TaxID=3064889 RepID=UPI00398B70F5